MTVASSPGAASANDNVREPDEDPAREHAHALAQVAHDAFVRAEIDGVDPTHAIADAFYPYVAQMQEELDDKRADLALANDDRRAYAAYARDLTSQVAQQSAETRRCLARERTCRELITDLVSALREAGNADLGDEEEINDAIDAMCADAQRESDREAGLEKLHQMFGLEMRR